MNLDKNLCILREEKGLSQERLAEKIGVSRQAVSKWELGQSYPDIDKLIALSDLFRISIDRLIRDNEEECSYNENEQIDCIDDGVIEFLCRAKKETYAGKGAETKPSRPNSHDLEYTEGNLKYIDTY
ncbi:helix-turn-helix transcriptional regulator [Halanaerobiaceae bacterium ANBcell28]